MTSYLAFVATHGRHVESKTVQAVRMAVGPLVQTETDFFGLGFETADYLGCAGRDSSMTSYDGFVLVKNTSEEAGLLYSCAPFAC